MKVKTPTLLSLVEIKRRYEDEHQIRLTNELDYFKKQESFLDAIENACLCIDARGKRFSHQKRIKLIVLKEIREKLIINSDKLLKCTSFKEIMDIVASCAVHGFGPLCIYDVSLRIAAWLSLEPEYIYLHSGTLKGAIALLGHTVKGKAYLSINDIPSPLNQLKPTEIEGVLCVFKDNFERIDRERTEN